MEAPHNYFTTTASTSTHYPAAATGAGTTTVGSAWKGPKGLVAGQYNAVLRAVVFNTRNNANSTVTIYDHAGNAVVVVTAGSSAATLDSSVVTFGPNGIPVGLGISAASSSASTTATIIFDAT